MCGTFRDLHAADTRYHTSCHVSFMSSKSTSVTLEVVQEGRRLVNAGCHRGPVKHLELHDYILYV